MKPHVIPLIAALVLVASGVNAAPSSDYVHGVVRSAEPIYVTQVQKTPIREQVCRSETVPVFSQPGSGGSRKGDDHEELEGLIAGGLVGSVIGNAVSDEPGAGTAGAVVGALIGRQQAEERQDYTPGVITSYRQQEVCRHEVTKVLEQPVEKLTGYKLDILVDGETITIKTDAGHQYQEGDTIRLSQPTDYRGYDDDDDDDRYYQQGYYVSDDDDDDGYDYDRRRDRRNGGLVGLTLNLGQGVFDVAANIARPVIHTVDLILFGW